MLLDALGHPITEGCTVITPGYYSPTMRTVTKIKKVTKTKVFLDAEVVHWSLLNGNWVPSKSIKTISRFPHQVLVIDKQLKYNKKAYPEHCL